MTKVLKCRFCEWKTVQWHGGWSRLYDHVDTKHPHIQIDPILVVTGTTDKGLQTLNRVEL